MRGTMVEKIGVLPSTLKKLREGAGLSIEDLARKLRVKPEKILAVESGRDSFTITQLERLADIYKVPLVAFFTTEIIETRKLPDYRINREKKLGQKTAVAIRWARYISESIPNLTGLRSKIPTLQDLPPEALANKLREMLGLAEPSFRSPKEAFNFYRNLIESKFSIGVIQYPLDEDVRAFSIKGSFSVIVLNESDMYSVKVFSLFHELCHLIRGEEGICSIDIDSEISDVERYCDKFAAEFLVPTRYFLKDIGRNPREKDVQIVARKYGVSMQVIMIKLLEVGYITRERYVEFKEKYKPKKGEGGKISWEERYQNRIGNLILEEISKAYRSGEITFYEAADILNIKTKYAEKLLG
ncbi:XRE family transcriptional regulator [Pyrococcus kukulkanii]|uniref:helix-turn-helix domain-containing protein n=1 Tax=Pyrococcus kukulkanii TaxID=1609559 RepID=UPI003565173A